MQFTHVLRSRPTALLLALLLGTMMTLTTASAGNTAAASAAAPGSQHTVAQTGQGKIRSFVYGSTGNNRRVSGNFVPMRFVTHNNKLFVRGLVQGVVHNRNGSTRTFAAWRQIRVKSINGTPARGRAAVAPRARCDVLNLVLAPLDLDLLGLQVHLDRVVLNIVAVSGAGNLLGNLLCAVTGLLDGGLGGLLSRVRNLLNRVLGILGLSA